MPRTPHTSARVNSNGSSWGSSTSSSAAGPWSASIAISADRSSRTAPSRERPRASRGRHRAGRRSPRAAGGRRRAGRRSGRRWDNRSRRGGACTGPDPSRSGSGRSRASSGGARAQRGRAPPAAPCGSRRRRRHARAPRDARGSPLRTGPASPSPRMEPSGPRLPGAGRGAVCGGGPRTRASGGAVYTRLPRTAHAPSQAARERHRGGGEQESPDQRTGLHAATVPRAATGSLACDERRADRRSGPARRRRLRPRGGAIRGARGAGGAVATGRAPEQPPRAASGRRARARRGMRERHSGAPADLRAAPGDGRRDLEDPGGARPPERAGKPA